VTQQQFLEKRWTKFYDPTIPDTLMPLPPMNLIQFLKKTAKEKPNKSALVNSLRMPRIGRQYYHMTFRQLDRASDAMACAFIDMGVKKGTKVSIIMPNNIAFVIAYYGLLKAGGVSTNINPTYPAVKIKEYLDYADTEIVVTYTALYNTIKEVQPDTKVRHVVVTNIKEYLPFAVRLAFTYTQEKKLGHYLENIADEDFWFQRLLKKHRRKKPDVEVHPDDMAMMQFTGGTTGVMKAAMATHQILANSAYISAYMTSIPFPQEWDPVQRSEMKILAVLPMFHVYGLVVMLGQAIEAGWEAHLVTDPRDTSDLIDIIHVEKPNIILGVPALWHALNHHPRIESGEVNFSSILYAQCAAAPMHPKIKHDYEARGGRIMVEGYGLSEVPTGNHSTQVYQDYREGSVGPPIPDVDCRIVDVETGTKELPDGEWGEIILHTPFMMHSYYKMPEETANVKREFDGKTFVYTGDIGYIDEDGFLYVVDRKKDMAIIGGFNVYPNIVEKAVKDHPSVEDAGVWGVPHPKLPGQDALQAWVVLKEGQKLKSADIVKFCKDKLAPYEIPRRIKFVSELPYSDAGKLLRRELPNIKK